MGTLAALLLALLLSLRACHKPQAEPPDNSKPDTDTTSSQSDVTTPEAEPPKAPAPAQLSDTTPAAPAENENPQDQAEPVQEQPPAEQEPGSQQAETLDDIIVKRIEESRKNKAWLEQQQQASGGGMTLEEAQRQGADI